MVYHKINQLRGSHENEISISKSDGMAEHGRNPQLSRRLETGGTMPHTVETVD
jgi:hypothetical protein